MTDLANRVGLTKPNACRLLGTLVDLGYVSKDDASRYTVTLKLWQIGHKLIAHADLHGAAQPVMQVLGAETRQSIGLAALDAGYIVYIGSLEAPAAIRPVVRLGSRIPAVATALGKAILAWRGEAELDEAMAYTKAFTAFTRTDREALEIDLSNARASGFATSRGEYEPGVCAIASPIFDANARAVAAIGAWGDEASIFGPSSEAIIRAVMKAAAEISRRLGFVKSMGSYVPDISNVAPDKGEKSPTVGS